MKSRFFVLCVCLLTSIPYVHGQILNTRAKVETLSMAERLSLRTNMIDWTLLLPNIGMEFDVLSTNWNRWAVGVSARGNWQSNHTFSKGMVYNLREAKLEVRNYWRFRDKPGSPLRYPLYVWYRGVYASFSNYSLLLFGNKGKQGDAFSVGVTFGFVKPLYEFKNRNTLDFEAGLSAGACYTQYSEYRHERESDCYPVTGFKNWHIVPYPVIQDLHVGFVYRFGHYPLTSKYRYRKDVDTDWATAREQRKLEKQTEALNKAIDKSDMENIRRFYHNMYQQLNNKYPNEKLK